MSTPTVLVVANSSWNLSHFRGGLIRALHKAHIRVVAAVPDGDPPVPELTTYSFPLKAESVAPLTELRSILGLIGILRAVKPAAVLSFTPKGNIYAGLAARAVGVPVIPNVSGLGTGFIRGGFLQRVQQALYREAFVTAPTVFFQNGDDSRLFEELGLIRPEQVRLLPGSGVDCRHFAAEPLAERKAGEAHLLFVGRLLGDKGLRELAEAMRRVRQQRPSVSLTLLGGVGTANRSAITHSEVSGWMAEGLLRHVSHADDVRPFLADADAVVLPSYREGMPRSLLEAAATGRPLLAADVPGCRELVTHGENGLLFEARSAESLAVAIVQFADTPMAERRRWGAAARRLAETRFDERHVSRAYLDLLVAKLEASR